MMPKKTGPREPAAAEHGTAGHTVEIVQLIQDELFK